MLDPYAQRAIQAASAEERIGTPVDARLEVGLAVGLTAIGLLMGSITDAMAWSLLLVCLVWIGLQLRQFKRVSRWSRRPWQRPKNGFDSWFGLAYGPYRALQRERGRSKQATARLRQILNLIELIPDGVLVLRENGELEGINNAASELLQLDDSDIGLVLSTILRSPDFVSYVRHTEFDEASQILEFASPVNADHTLEARRFAINDGGQILIIRDITTLNRLLTVRQNFVANVSHELRTPLAVIQGYMETITSDDEDTEMRLALTGRLVSPLNRLQALVDDLLLLTRLESTDIESERLRIDLGQTVEAVVRDLGDLHAANMRIDLQLDPQTYITGNPGELSSLCVNLISNALRYSAQDSRVEISCKRIDQYVHLSVQDFGVGIAPEHLERLTERFYRVDMADARTRGGTGLGLAIVKHVLRRHNSTLQIDSELGKGSRFACEFLADMESGPSDLIPN